ncbi:MAG TPA: phosphate signaling complex protein PhoU [Verrucomicrobiae bacterium]|nr:phosphate signaling complex protein PhoU [Verrucomicrobiae bacterium]
MRLHLEEEIRRIKENLLMMASLTDRSLSQAIRALVGRDDQLAAQVEADDTQLDSLQVAIDEGVVMFIAKQRPVATDLRLVMVALKIAGDLERVGDQAVSIARAAIQLNREVPLEMPADMSRLATISVEMVREAIACFVEGTPERVPALVQRDKEADAINRKLFSELIARMEADPSIIRRAVHLLLVVRRLERVADHAKSIAEEVYYLGKAVDIRHAHPKPTLPRGDVSAETPPAG